MGRDVALEVPGGWIKVSAVELAAIAKRARKREKREEDARRTEEGRTSAAWGVGALGLPWRAGFWDYYEGVSGRLRGPLNLWLSSREPRWRLRLEHRRALPMASTWLDSEAQFLRLRRPRSFMTRAWRWWRRGIAAASWRLAKRCGE